MKTVKSAPASRVAAAELTGGTAHLTRKMTCGGSGAGAVRLDEASLGVAGMRHDPPCCLEAEAYHRIPDRDRVPRLAAPALDAAAVEFGGNGAERLTGELLAVSPRRQRRVVRSG